MIILIPLFLGLGGSAFWLWMLIDCAQNEPEEDEKRRRWVSLVALTHCFGALLYYCLRRPRRASPHRQAFPDAVG
ncbi:MAG TPA: hypothetical protein VLV83_22460 [Acidobacteriota bacterium]|nr:hypothetical protein [Acidobacteriota bacterium]